MALPAGVITATVQFGAYLDDAGEPSQGRVVFTSSRPRVWVATGDVIGPSGLSVDMVAGAGSIVLPVTDQPGYTDGYGNPDPPVVYTAEVRRDGWGVRSIVFALPSAGLAGQTYDLDAMIPVTPPPGPVINVDLGVIDDAVAEATEAAEAAAAASAASAADAALFAADANTSVEAAADQVDLAAAEAAAAAGSASTAQGAATSAQGAATAAQGSASAASGSAGSASASASAAAATAAAVPRWWAGTQAAYDALPVKDPTTLYVITG